MTSLPSPEDARRVTSILQEHLRWSAFWDKQRGVWRVAEDDPAPAAYGGKCFARAWSPPEAPVFTALAGCQIRAGGVGALS